MVYYFLILFVEFWKYWKMSSKSSHMTYIWYFCCLNDYQSLLIFCRSVNRLIDLFVSPLMSLVDVWCCSLLETKIQCSDADFDSVQVHLVLYFYFGANQSVLQKLSSNMGSYFFLLLLCWFCLMVEISAHADQPVLLLFIPNKPNM